MEKFDKFHIAFISIWIIGRLSSSKRWNCLDYMYKMNSNCNLITNAEDLYIKLCSFFCCYFPSTEFICSQKSYVDLLRSTFSRAARMALELNGCALYYLPVMRERKKKRINFRCCWNWLRLATKWNEPAHIVYFWNIAICESAVRARNEEDRGREVLSQHYWLYAILSVK